MNAVLACSLVGLSENLNLIIVLTFIGYCVYGFFRGCFAQLVGAISTLVAIIFATLLAKPVFSMIAELTSIDEFFLSKLLGWSNASFPELKSVTPEAVEAVVSALPFPKFVKNTVLKYGSGLVGDVNLCYLIAKTFASYITMIICFIILFVLIKVLFFFAKGLVKELRERTTFRVADSAFGIVLSFFQAFRLFSGIFFVINFLPFFFLNDIKAAVANSVFANLITRYNLYTWLFSLIQL